MSDKRCRFCTRDPDPRGPSVCFYCRELNAPRVPSPRIPQHVAGLARAVDEHVVALRCESPDVYMTELALGGAVFMYCVVEELDEQAVVSRDLSDTHVDRVMLRLIRAFDAESVGRETPHMDGWRALAREAIRIGAVAVDEEVPS